MRLFRFVFVAMQQEGVIAMKSIYEKALKDGIYIKDHLGLVRKMGVEEIDEEAGLLLFDAPDEFAGFAAISCEYGSSWAFTKEELE